MPDLSAHPHRPDVLANTSPSATAVTADGTFEDRWAMWVARGDQQDIAVRRKLRVMVALGALAAVVEAIRLVGGGL